MTTQYPFGIPSDPEVNDKVGWNQGQQSPQLADL